MKIKRQKRNTSRPIYVMRVVHIIQLNFNSILVVSGQFLKLCHIQAKYLHFRWNLYIIFWNSEIFGECNEQKAKYILQIKLQLMVELVGVL